MDRSPIIPGGYVATHVKPTALIRRGGRYRLLLQGREIDMRVTNVIAQPVGDPRKEVVLIPIIIRGTMENAFADRDTTPTGYEYSLKFSLIQGWVCLEEPPADEEEVQS